MTTPIKSQRFRLRQKGPRDGDGQSLDQSPDQRVDALPDEFQEPAAAAEPFGSDMSERPAVILRKRKRPDADPAKARAAAPTMRFENATDMAEKPKAVQPVSGPQTIESIREEGLSARQLRMAMRVSKRHGIKTASAYEAVLKLRQRGIDPFAQSTALDLVRKDPDDAPGRELVKRDEARVPDITPAPPSGKDRLTQIAADREKELEKIQREIATRRRKRLRMLGARLLAFVAAPTLIVSLYFYVIATPMYGTEAEFIIQQADSQGGMGDLAGMLPSAGGMGLGGQQEAASVQSFLQSRGAMLRLDQEEEFRAHFQDAQVDFWRRLAPDASSEAAFRTYRRHVKIGYDPTEGVVRMEVLAASPEDSERFARALVRFAEAHVDMMTQRLRESQMREARQSLEEAHEKLIDARLAAVAIQERSSVMSGEVEISLLSQQIGALEAELTQTRLSLQEILSNPRPNQARVQPLERREQRLRQEIEMLRASMTRGDGAGQSLARVQSELIMAEAEVQTREMMRAHAMQQLETARIEVSRQVRYLALTVEPIAPDEATYPRKLENSALAFLIFLGIYLFMSMTGSVLREQVSG